MDFSRIRSAVDVEQLLRSEVTIIGAGGSAGLAEDLARCGVGGFQLFDFDAVSAENIARQDHHPDQIGRLKVLAVSDAIRRIQPQARVLPVPRDFLSFADDEIDALLSTSDLLISAADDFQVAARVNELALRLGKSALWIGLYSEGSAGEIIFWHTGIAACFRCLGSRRYETQARAREAGRKLDPSSDGCTILDVALLDAIAGQLAIGLLTRSSDNRHGRLIDALGDRNCLQVQIDPDWTIQGRRLIREELGIADDNDAYFSWSTIARRDPDRGLPPCPDCVRFRDRQSGLPPGSITG